MSVYAFWNNKGGTGKTSLSFQAICGYAEKYPERKILAIDLCPQANLSELLLGGLMGEGSKNLSILHSKNKKRKSVGGYFQDRLPSPFARPNIVCNDYISTPNEFNNNVCQNIDLLAGDSIVELQSNPIATLSNTQVPGTNTWLAVIDWVRDFISETNDNYDVIFIDANPSFSVYTQIAISAADRLVLPVMADDSSRRAIQNAFSLIHGIKLPSNIYDQYSFSTKLREAGRSLPIIHLIVKNRLTQYMGPASAYSSVLTAINEDINELLKEYPNIFSFNSIDNGVVDIRDFQTTGVVAFAEGKPFSKVNVGIHKIYDNETQIRADYLNNCQDAIKNLVNKL